jgi:asparagine synthetase B (glutamine-hydrolysing)
LVKLSQFPLQKRLDYFTAINQGIRLTNMNEVFRRSYFEVRYPFCDIDLIDYVYSMPIEFRMHDKLYLAVINKITPGLTWVPRASNNQFLTDNRIINTFTKYWHKIGDKIIKDQRPVGHEDPAGWLRNDLQEWTKSVLFCNSMEEHGLFNIDFLRSLYERHMSGHEGHNIVGKIAPVMTYEMMLQRFFG